MKTFFLPDFALFRNVYWTVPRNGGRLCRGATWQGITESTVRQGTFPLDRRLSGEGIFFTSLTMP